MGENSGVKPSDLCVAFTSENDGMVPFNHQQWMRKMMMGICVD